jgi:hypothetical protein
MTYAEPDSCPFVELSYAYADSATAILQTSDTMVATSGEPSLQKQKRREKGYYTAIPFRAGLLIPIDTAGKERIGT